MPEPMTEAELDSIATCCELGRVEALDGERLIPRLVCELRRTRAAIWKLRAKAYEADMPRLADEVREWADEAAAELPADYEPSKQENQNDPA